VDSSLNRRDPQIKKAIIPPARPAAPSPRPAAPSDWNVLGPLLGKSVVARLTFGDSITGTLHAFTKYELVVVEGDGSKVIVFKGSVASIREEAKP
jgi:hypothetical protein